MKLSSIVRYTLATIILIGIIAISNIDKINITQKEINNGIEKKLPIIKKQKLLRTKITKFKTKSSNNSDDKINAIVNVEIEYPQINKEKIINKISSFFGSKKELPEVKKENKIYKLNVNIDAEPYVKNNKIYLKITNIEFEDNVLNSHAKSIEKYLPILLNNKSIYNMDKIKHSKYFNLEKIEIIADSSEYYIKTYFEISTYIYFLLFLSLFLLLLREIGILLIKFYRKFLSNKKSYSCAKGHETGETCSATVLKDFKKNGFYSGMGTYFNSTKECKGHYENIQERKKNNSGSACNGCDPTYACIGLDIHACSSGGAKGCDGPGSCDVGSC